MLNASLASLFLFKEREDDIMGLFVLLIAFWVPFLIAMLFNASWWIALIVGSVACGIMFAYLVIKSYSREKLVTPEMTAMERAEMAM